MDRAAGKCFRPVARTTVDELSDRESQWIKVSPLVRYGEDSEKNHNSVNVEEKHEFGKARKRIGVVERGREQ